MLQGIPRILFFCKKKSRAQDKARLFENRRLERADHTLAPKALDFGHGLGDRGQKRIDRARFRRALVAAGRRQFLDSPRCVGDAPGTDRKRRSTKPVSDFCLGCQRHGRRIGQLRRQRLDLQPEQPEQFGLEFVIAEALPGQVNKIEGGIEAARVLSIAT